MSRIRKPWGDSSPKTRSITSHNTFWPRLLSVALALLLWQLLAMLVGSQLLLPSPLSVLGRLLGIWREAGFWTTVWFTFRRIVSGFLLAVAAGSFLGALAGRFRLFETLFYPFSATIKSVPVASFIIICLIWLSSDQLSIFIPFLMVLPVVYTNVLQGVRSTDESLLEAVRVFPMAWHRRMRYLWLPETEPYFSSACGIGLGLAWKSGIAAEIIGIPAGSIGRRFYDAKIYFDTVDLFAWTVIVVLISILFEKLFMTLLHALYGRMVKG